MDYDTLRAVRILRDLTDPELEAFANLLTIREVKSGERILEEGTVVNHFYIVCEGTGRDSSSARTFAAIKAE